MPEPSPWTVDHPLVRAIVHERISKGFTVSASAVCRILEAIDAHRTELRLGETDSILPMDLAMFKALNAIVAESGQQSEDVLAVVLIYGHRMSADLVAEHYTEDHPLTQALAIKLSLHPAVVAAALRDDEDFFAREGLDGPALTRRVIDGMKNYWEDAMRHGELRLPEDDTS